MNNLVERELELPAPAEDVWRALTDSHGLEAWLADEVRLELWPGGEASFTSGDRVRTGWVEEVSPPSQNGRADGVGWLAFWWAEDQEPASRVELVLTPIAEQTTHLRVLETRPLEILDLVGLPLPGPGSTSFGPALVAA